jgi:hypothetical protein
VDSFIGTSEFSTNLFNQIDSLKFVKDSTTVLLLHNDHQDDDEEEKDNKIQGFSKNFLLRGLVYQDEGNWIRFMLIKDEIHMLSNDLRRNLF